MPKFHRKRVCGYEKLNPHSGRLSYHHLLYLALSFWFLIMVCGLLGDSLGGVKVREDRAIHLLAKVMNRKSSSPTSIAIGAPFKC